MKPTSHRAGVQGLFSQAGSLGLVAVAIFLIALPLASAIPNILYMSLIAPGLLLGTIGSTLLGIRFLRSAYHPRLTGWVLVLSLPLWIVGRDVLGHNSLGLVPLFVAWAGPAGAYGDR